MAKIAFIAPDKQLFLQAKKIIHALGMESITTLYLARLKKSVLLAKKLQGEDFDVIICRGGTAQAIINSNIPIPVVEITVTGQDLAQLFHEAKVITKFPHPKVSMIAFSNMTQDVDALSKILGINLTVYRLNSLEAIAEKVEEVSKSDTDVIAGGIKTITLASKKGIKTLLIRSGDTAIRNAFTEAKKMILARKIEKEQAQKFKALAEYSLEGIVSVNSSRIIEIFNPAAERLLHRSAKDSIGKQIDLILNFLDIEPCLLEGKEYIGQTIQLGNSWITYNIAPVIVDNTVTGAIATFQDITHIQEVEAKIRNQVLTRNFHAKYHLNDIVGISEQIEETKRIAREISQVDATILISGPSGTGKELFAQSIHNESPRKRGPFVAVNCAALPSNLLESELFGYVEGAFTGANKKGKPGLFEMAHKGSIFLDEISEMDLQGQSRLLRILQERQVMRLGDNKYIPIDTRVIVATNKNLEKAVLEGHFRQDLFYRLKVLTLNLPPLNERIGDVKCLTDYFLNLFNKNHNKRLKIDFKAYNYLSEYDWPGNVRELMHFMERLVIVSNESTITVDTIRRYWEGREYNPRPTISDLSPSPIFPSEKAKLISALDQCNYNITKAAHLLNIDRGTLYNRLRKYKIEIKKMSKVYINGYSE